jgi:hypothetical protein
MNCARTRKTHVSDRAKRYRANQEACRPSGSRECAICGSTRFLTIDHKDGNESNGAKSNLRWLCKSCNTRKGAKMARKGKGRRTAQYNPTASGGAANLFEYILAGSMHTRKAHDEGGAIIHATPKSKRREFASEIWARRKSHGNPLSKWTPAILNGARVRIRAVGKGLQIDLGKVGR